MTIKVFVVDDSAIVRQSLKKIVNSSPALEWLGSAIHPLDAMEKLKKLGKPDVMILDIEMPEMDGLTYLRQIMASDPLPVIICSSVAQQGSANAMIALELGALEVIPKPKVGVREFLEDSGEQFLDAIQAAAQSRLRGAANPHESRPLAPMSEHPLRLVAFGSSTGGVGVLETILAPLAPPKPPILVVQHMPGGFTQAFARRLDSLCALKVSEAQDGEWVEPSCVYIAPGSFHLQATKEHDRVRLLVRDGPRISGHKPSVDALFSSLTKIAPEKTAAFLLTGMGRDGAEGMRQLAHLGAYCIAQEEGSCTVYGMPRAAMENGAAKRAMTPQEMIAYLKGAVLS